MSQDKPVLLGSRGGITELNRREYSSWSSMMYRCYTCKPGTKSYLYWRSKGFKVCDRWFEFKNFLADMGKRPPDMTLDRIDGTKGYFPENCRWADKFTQNQNRRYKRWIIHGKVYNSLLDAEAKTGINESVILRRTLRGTEGYRTESVHHDE